MRAMRHTLLAAALLLATPALAQDEPPRTFLEQWADQMMQGLVDEITPEIERFMNELGPEFEAMMEGIVPALTELLSSLGGIAYYEMPEILPNGDIIIRRKESAPPVQIDPDTNAPIEL